MRAPEMKSECTSSTARHYDSSVLDSHQDSNKTISTSTSIYNRPKNSHFPDMIRYGDVSTRATRSASVRETWVMARTKGKTPDSTLARIVFNPRFETFGGFVVLFNFMIMTMETHATKTEDANVLRFVKITNRCLLLYYTAEVVARLHVMKRTFFRAGWNLLDFTIVVTGWMSEFLEIFEVSAGMDQIAMLKSLRMLRLLRLVRLFVAFRELYVLVAGIGRCMKTLFWASGLIFMVLNVWAILSVEFLDVYVKQLMPTGVYSTCGWCETAFSNIWYSNLTWFQIVSTADWAPIGRPLAEEFYWPYVFFVVNIFVVMWGLLNLIVAAIVDANIAAREDDIAIAAKIRDQAHKEAWTSFEDICRDMDEDGSGDVSVEEFKKFLAENLELQQHLTIMGIQDHDVDDLLKLMDEDGSGTLECDEFIEQFTAMRTLVEKTTLFFLLKFSQSIQHKLIQQSQTVESIHAEVIELRDSCDTRRSLATHEELATKSRGYHTLESAGSLLISAEASSFGTPERRDTVTCDGGWVAFPTARNITPPTLRTASHPDVSNTNKKTLPPGWYYFGASLPREASAWCKAIDPNFECTTASNSPWTRYDVDDIKEPPVATDGQRWEPLLSNGFGFTNGQRWDSIPSRVVGVHSPKHIGSVGDQPVAQPVDDVNLPQECMDSLASVDKVIDHLSHEHLALIDDFANEHDIPNGHDRVHMSVNAMEKGSITF